MSDSLPDPRHDKSEPVDPDTARIVLCLDDAIAAFRVGEATGIPALDCGHAADGRLGLTA
jgi:hypothetical protein